MTDQCALEALKIFAESPCGDVRAARSCAITLLADASGADLAGQRLLVTAALLYLQSETGAPRLTLRSLSAILTSLSTEGAARRAFARSPSLLVQYVAVAAQEGDLDAALSAAPNLLVTAGAWEGQAPARLRPSLPPSERRRSDPSTRERRNGGASSGDRT